MSGERRTIMARLRCQPTKRPMLPVYAAGLSGLMLFTIMLVSISGALYAEELTERKLIDLTYGLDTATVAWPTTLGFQRHETAWGMTARGYWYASGDFSMSEHAGTHIDAPIHFAKGQPSVDRIPLERLMAPAVVVDVRQAVKENPDYRLMIDDLRSWETRHGRIPAGAIVIMYSGWGRHWPDRPAYFGSTTPEDTATFHFPGFSREAAEFLTAERNIVGIGIDTASIDYGPSRDFIVHQIINGAGLYGLENIAQLEQIPESGALLIALPLKIQHGSGGPVRIVAVLP